MPKPFSFLADDYSATTAAELADKARAAEALGITTFVIPDHLVPIIIITPILAINATRERFLVDDYMRDRKRSCEQPGWPGRGRPIGL